MYYPEAGDNVLMHGLHAVVLEIKETDTEHVMVLWLGNAFNVDEDSPVAVRGGIEFTIPLNKDPKGGWYLDDMSTTFGVEYSNPPISPGDIITPRRKKGEYIVLVDQFNQLRIQDPKEFNSYWTLAEWIIEFGQYDVSYTLRSKVEGDA